jgi:hypothetical protein
LVPGNRPPDRHSHVPRFKIPEQQLKVPFVVAIRIGRHERKQSAFGITSFQEGIDLFGELVTNGLGSLQAIDRYLP